MHHFFLQGLDRFDSCKRVVDMYSTVYLDKDYSDKHFLLTYLLLLVNRVCLAVLSPPEVSSPLGTLLLDGSVTEPPKLDVQLVQRQTSGRTCCVTETCGANATILQLSLTAADKIHSIIFAHVQQS